MKKLILLVTLTLTLQAFAGLQVDPVLNGGTNSCAAFTTNSYQNTANLFFLGRTTDATFAFTFNCGGASTANYTLTFDASADGTTEWKTNALVWQVAGNGVSTNTYTTNLAKGQLYPFYRTGQIWNTNATTPAISNILVRVFTKDGF